MSIIGLNIPARNAFILISLTAHWRNNTIRFISINLQLINDSLNIVSRVLTYIFTILFLRSILSFSLYLEIHQAFKTVIHRNSEHLEVRQSNPLYIGRLF